MAYSLFLGLCILTFFHGSFVLEVTSESNVIPEWMRPFRPRGSSQRTSSPCQFQEVQALQPNLRIESEAGITEIWQPKASQQFRCAGVAVIRRVIRSQGLLLPGFINAPSLAFVTQGMGIKGTVLSGCPETFETSWQSQSQFQRQQQSDRHQKVEQVNEGELLAFPAGTTHWIYNNGQSNLILVELVDIGSRANQLDFNLRKFFLAGSPRLENYENVLNGFSTQILGQSFNIPTELARKLQSSKNETRGVIIYAQQGLRLLTPHPQGQGQQGQGARQDNGLEETICTMRLTHKIAGPAVSDIYNPHAGHISTVNAVDFPILNLMGLSAARGVLYPNAILAPQWIQNAHKIIYITRGNALIQIVGSNGQNIFNDRVQQGEIVIVPQNFAVVKKAGNNGVDWVSFRTNSNAMTNMIAGRNSVINNLPAQLLKVAFRMSDEQAHRLKRSRREMTLFSPLQQEQTQYDEDEKK